uniref:Reverse transcriptase domain-containing protein n=1 Tax=Tanacetum cinerariifolium TaxID=118510 RepID=A0A6L2JG68_TANCI|nr:hypothetical protein [Tanacetum cinerariifolium]
MGMVEEENASLRGSIKTMEAIDTITRRQEKKARMELKRQLTSVQESQRQDQENFRKLQEFVTSQLGRHSKMHCFRIYVLACIGSGSIKKTIIMPTTRQGANVSMTLEAVQAMIDQTLLRNNTTDDGSQNSGTTGVVSLSQWVEKMESVFLISGCAIENQVKFATCTLLGAALTGWNGHVRTLGHDAAYADLKVKGNDVGGYTQRFQELALMCTKFISNETEKVDKYISGLPDNIHGNVMAARPKTLDDAIELANDLMDHKLRTYAEGQAENKRKLDNNHQAQQ